MPFPAAIKRNKRNFSFHHSLIPFCRWHFYVFCLYYHRFKVSIISAAARLMHCLVYWRLNSFSDAVFFIQKCSKTFALRQQFHPSMNILTCFSLAYILLFSRQILYPFSLKDKEISILFNRNSSRVSILSIDIIFWLYFRNLVLVTFSFVSLHFFESICLVKF